MRSKQFYNFINTSYIPSMYELNPEPTLKPKYRAYGYSGIKLYYEMFKLINPYIKNGTIILDAGAYPGTFLRILKGIIKDRRLELHAAGKFFLVDEIETFHNRINKNPETNCIKTELDLINFLRSENIISHKIGLDYCSFGNTSIESEDLKNLYGKCDIVTSMEVIEHLHTPYKLFDLFYNLLKPGGICVLETNNVRNLWGIKKLFSFGSNLDPDLCNKYRLNNGLSTDPHIRFYSIKELTKLFKKAGFSIEQSYDFNFYIPLKYINNFKTKIVIWCHFLNFVPGYRSHVVVLAKKV